MTCLAPRLIEKDERNLGLSHLLPVAGPCPKCGQELLWGELVRASKYRANEKNSDGRVKSKRKRKAVGVYYMSVIFFGGSSSFL